MSRAFTCILAAGAFALAGASAAGAATFTVQIKASGYSPGTLTINHGDKITFHNADRVDHQVVANDGSFASPILHPGQTWTSTFVIAGTVHYHDALYPRLAGRITIKGPPPSVSLALNEPIAAFGSSLMLSGAISTGAPGQSVEIDGQQWGLASPVQLAIVKTGVNGTFGYAVTPSLYTTYVARWNNVVSGSVIAQVEPVLHLLPGASGYMRASVAAGKSMFGKHVYLQRLSSLGQWVNIAALDLGPLNGRIFLPVSYLPMGSSRIRVFLSVNQAGNGLLSAHSGTQTITRRK